MTPTMLVCKQCNFENEPERVYCHNCGAKLDRSLLPPEATKREDPVIVQERVRKMVSPRRGMGLRGIKHLVFSLSLAALFALLAVMARTPEGVPVVNPDAVLDAPPITDDMEAQQQVPGAHRMAYTENQANAFLGFCVRGKEGAVSNFALKFERVFVHFEEGSCAITTEHSLFGYPLYATTIHSIGIQNGSLVSENLGGGFGRLAVPAKAMKYLDIIFSPVWNLLDHDQRLLSQMQAVNFHKESVEMITRPTPGH